MDSQALQQQFELLQQQQAKKLARRKQATKPSEKANEKAPEDDAFGIDDDLDLKLADPPAPKSTYLSDDLVNHLNEQIRELKDENGRLYKLLSERDFEVRQLKKKREEDRQVISGGGVASDQVATKIVELSKKVRELTAEAESEKTKAKQYARQCKDLQKQLDKAPQDSSVPPTARTLFTSLEDGRTYTEADYKSLLDRAKQAEAKVSEYRNQNQSLRNELKMAQKVITSECGEGVTIQALMKEGANWRGRAQQIIALQRKVTELKAQSDQPNRTKSRDDLEMEMMGTTSTKKTLDGKQRDAIKRLEKERKDAQEKAQSELKALEEEHSSLKEKWNASKARNKVLSNEVKSLKQHVQRLLDKGRHDDELIDALMKQQAKLKTMVDDNTSKVKKSEMVDSDKVRELAAKVQQDTNITEQLRAIVQEKETMVKSLEEEIRNMRQTNIQKSQVEAANTLFNRVASRTSSRHGDRSPIGSPNPPSRLSMRSISRQSAITNGDTTDRPSSRWGAAKLENQGQSVDNSLMSELQAQVQEFKSLSQASEVERDKLVELVQVLQKRLDEANFKSQDANVDLTAQKKKVVLLEKQLGKAKLELNQHQPKSGIKKVRSRTMDEDSMNESTNSANIEEIETRLAIQMDENEALKAALESTLKSKEEDLKMYNDMLDQTKQVFIQGIRQHRQNSAH